MSLRAKHLACVVYVHCRTPEADRYDRLGKDHSSHEGSMSMRIEGQNVHGEFHPWDTPGEAAGTRQNENENIHSDVRENEVECNVGQSMGTIDYVAGIGNYEPITLNQTYLNLCDTDENLPGPKIGVKQQIVLGPDPQWLQERDNWNNSAWWISFRQPVESNKRSTPSQATGKARLTMNRYAKQGPKARPKERSNASEPGRASSSQSYAKQVRNIGARDSTQSQFVTFSVHERNSEQEKDRETLTGEKKSVESISVPFKLSFTIGKIVTNIDISDLVEMACRPAREQSPVRGRKRGSQKSTCECRECRSRLDAQDRRIDELENMIAERTSELKMSTDELCDEIRNVGISVDNQGSGPVLITPIVPEVSEVGRLVRGIRTNPVRMDSTAGKQKKMGADKATARPRAASFAGVAAHAPREGDDGWRYVHRDSRRAPCSPEVAPKPQTLDSKRGRASRSREPVVEPASRAREGMMRDWLSTAKRDPPRNSEVPSSDRRPVVDERSPSWADIPPPDDDEFDTSNSLTPIPNGNGNGRRDNTSPPCSPSSPDNSDHDAQDVDVYKLPLSGQVTERRGLKNGNPRDGGNGDHNGARPKSRGKPQEMREKKGLNDKGGKKPNAKEGKTSYSKVVTSSGWKTVQSKKR